MTAKGQALCMLREFIQARRETPWLADWFEMLSEREDCWMGPRFLIMRLGGMAGNWYE